MSRGRPSGGAERRGFAVVAVLLVLIGLMGLAHGALLLAGRERVASVLEARLISRRLVARGATRLPRFPDTLPSLGVAPRLLSSGARDAAHWWAHGLALGPEMTLVTGVAAVDGVPGEDRVGVLLWMLGPSERVAEATAVVESGGGAQLFGGTVDETGWLVPPSPSAPGVCAGELGALDSLGARALPPVGALPVGDPGVPAGAAPPGLGLLPGDTLLDRIPASFHLAGEVSPSAVVWGGICAPGFSNWGSPADPTGPCGTRMALVAADRDLVVRGGEGQGVLVVRGSLRLTDGARVHGVALVGGDLIVEQGSTLVGMARIRGSLRLRDAGRVEGSACAAARALRASTPLRLPLFLPGARIHPL